MNRAQLTSIIAVCATVSLVGTASAFGGGHGGGGFGGGGHMGGGGFGGGMHMGGGPIGGGGTHMGGRGAGTELGAGGLQTGRSVGIVGATPNARLEARPGATGSFDRGQRGDRYRLHRGGFARRGRLGFVGDYGYGSYGYDAYGYGYGDDGSGDDGAVQTGRSAAEAGESCTTPVKTCGLRRASIIGQSARAEAAAAGARGASPPEPGRTCGAEPDGSTRPRRGGLIKFR